MFEPGKDVVRVGLEAGRGQSVYEVLAGGEVVLIGLLPLLGAEPSEGVNPHHFEHPVSLGLGVERDK